MVAIAAALVAITAFMIVPSLDSDGIGSTLGVVFGLAFLVLVTYAIAAMGWAFLRIFRTGTWLKGSILVQRRIVRRSRADLRTAQVELRNADAQGVLEMLVKPKTGISQRLLIKKGNVTLPAHQLQAIADAIVAGRRRVVAHESAFVVADRLRQLAGQQETSDPRRP